MKNSPIQGFRLSPQQKRLWFLQRAAGRYCAQCAILIEGELDPAGVPSAVEGLVARYEILRTTFRRRPGRRLPIQVIGERGTFLWSVADLRTAAPAECRARIEAELGEQMRTPFDLENGPVLRAHLMRLADRRHLLSLTLPSLCGDRETLKLLAADLARYLRNGHPEPQAESDVAQYSQFSEYQNEMLEDEEAEAGKQIWRSQGLERIPATTLPLERVEADWAAREFDSITIELDDALRAKLAQVAAAHDSSLQVVLLGAWLTLLSRLSAQTDIVVANVFDGRKYEELQGVVGLLAKAVPVRCRFEEHDRFTEIIGKTAASLHQADEWQEYFLRTEGAAFDSSSLDSTIGFEYSRWPAAVAGAAGLSVSVYGLSCDIERFKLKLNGLERPDSLVLEVVFDGERYDRSDVVRLASRLEQLLQSISADPCCKATDLDWLSAAELQDVLFNFNRTADQGPAPKTISRWFEEQVERTPHHRALTFEDQHLTSAWNGRLRWSSACWQY